MNEAILKSFIDAVKDITMTGVIVIKDGEKIAQYQWESEIRQNQYSASKSFTSAAVGIAIEEGLLKLDDPVLKFFEEQAPQNPCRELENLTVRHLLTMSVGQEKSCLMGEDRLFLSEHNWVKYALNQSFAYEPGTHFLYSNTGPYLAGMIVQKQSGCNLVDYLIPRLFEPLGMLHPTWEYDPLGNTFGAGGLFIPVSDMAKFGQLYLQNGEWNGKQLISKEWVEETAKLQMKTGRENESSSEYGLLFWRGPHESFRADGKYGQYSIVLPQKNAVIAINAYNRNQGDILDCVWKYLYPEI